LRRERVRGRRLLRRGRLHRVGWYLHERGRWRHVRHLHGGRMLGLWRRRSALLPRQSALLHRCHDRLHGRRYGNAQHLQQVRRRRRAVLCGQQLLGGRLLQRPQQLHRVRIVLFHGRADLWRWLVRHLRRPRPAVLRNRRHRQILHGPGHGLQRHHLRCLRKGRRDLLRERLLLHADGLRRRRHMRLMREQP